MADDLDRMFEEAERKGQETLSTEPRARDARYDPRSGRVRVELDNGCVFAFPARRAQGLEDASDAALAAVEILGLGYGLRFPALDVDLAVAGLLAGLFGTKAWMDRQRAAQAGRGRPVLKAEVARRNGRKGGRPRKVGMVGGES